MNMLHRLLIAALLFSAIGVVYPQYTGPGSKQRIHTVKELKDNALKLDRQDIVVALRGSIVQQIDNKTYLFKDSTGSIHVEIKKKYLPTFKFDETTLLIIYGEVDYDLLEGTEVEVESIERVAMQRP